MMNIYQSITKIMEEVPSIGKTQRNKTQGFMYRGIDDVMNALQPLLAKNKVFIVPEILEQMREERTTSKGGNLIYSICKIKYKFYAEDGSSVEAITIGEGMDSGDKATNKAMAIAMKYALFQVFCIPTDEMKDPDSETPEQSTKKSNTTDNQISEEDAKKVEAMMKEMGWNVEELLQKNYKISKTTDLTASQYVKILEAIKKQRRQNNMNKVILLGRLTKDPETRYTQSTNTQVTSFTLAVNRRFVKQEEERQADFINIVSWNKTAEFVSKYFSKGQQVGVIGRIQTRNYDDEQGVKHYITEVIAEEVYFAGEKKEKAQNDPTDDFEITNSDDLPF